MEGNQLVPLLEKHKGEKYVLGTIAPKNQPNYRGPWDCAEFASWGIYQISNKLYGCANNNGNPASADAYSGFWGRDAHKLGKIISINEAYNTPGALLLRLAGNGQLGHIVISKGDGTTIEAHSTKKGVINSVVSGRRWDYGILVPWLTYQTNSFPEVGDVNKKPTGTIYRYTIPMMVGEAIKQIQRKLCIEVDGKYGPGTFAAVRAFQIKKGLVPDGEVGPKTLKALGLV